MGDALYLGMRSRSGARVPTIEFVVVSENGRQERGIEPQEAVEW
jgi:hypothetical protein